MVAGLECELDTGRAEDSVENTATRGKERIYKNNNRPGKKMIGASSKMIILNCQQSAISYQRSAVSN